MQGQPRIQARVGEIEEPEEYKGKYAFEVILSFIGESEGRKLGDWGPFDTEKEARAEMKEVCKVVAEECEKAYGKQPDGKYLDLKTNELRNWEDH